MKFLKRFESHESGMSREEMCNTLKGLKEHQENENYMFFTNIENIHRMCEEILSMDKNSIDKVLSDGHGWATDHIATSKDDVEEVYNFLKTHSHESEEILGGHMSNPKEVRIKKWDY